MSEPTEELEPLFDYSRVQPFDIVCLDDDDASPICPAKRMKASNSIVENGQGNGNVIHIVDCDDKEELDWLPPPPKVSIDAQKPCENSTIKDLRLKKQELVSFAQSAENLLRTVEESVSVKRDLRTSMESCIESVAGKPSRLPVERAKIVISIQDKDGTKQFRIYMDEKFERLFKMYADKVKHDVQSLVFCFDGDKINPATTPSCLGMEDDDIIEVHVKSS